MLLPAPLTQTLLNNLYRPVLLAQFYLSKLIFLFSPTFILCSNKASALLSGMPGWGDRPRRVELEKVSDTLPALVYPLLHRRH